MYHKACGAGACSTLIAFSGLNIGWVVLLAVTVGGLVLLGLRLISRKSH